MEFIVNLIHTLLKEYNVSNLLFKYVFKYYCSLILLNLPLNIFRNVRNFHAGHEMAIIAAYVTEVELKTHFSQRCSETNSNS